MKIRAERSAKAYIYCFDVKKIQDDTIKILEFLQYDEKWVKFITKSRLEGYESDYDIIYDKMADSQYTDISDVLLKYKHNEIDAIGVIDKIKWKQSEIDQYCFKTSKALSLLYNKKIIVQYKDEFGIWRQEKR